MILSVNIMYMYILISFHQ